LIVGLLFDASQALENVVVVLIQPTMQVLMSKHTKQMQAIEGGLGHFVINRAIDF